MPLITCAAAHQQHQRDPHLRQEPISGEKNACRLGRVDALVEDPRSTARLEAVQLVLLAGEGLDDADPGDVLLRLGGQLGDPLLHLLLGGPRDAVVARGGEDDNGAGASAISASSGLIAQHHRSLARVIVRGSG